MKIKGKVVDAPSNKVVVIPRDGGDIVFTAKPILDYSEFDKLCPRPEPPVKKRPGMPGVPNENHPDYLKAIDAISNKRVDWMTLKSLEATEDLKWDTVKMDDPSTWANFRKELKASFGIMEINRIQMAVMDACCLNSDAIDEATETFLLTTRKG